MPNTQTPYEQMMEYGLPEQGLVELSLIEPSPRNYRKHPASQIAAIAASYKRFGQMGPVVVRRQAGTNRVQLAAGEGRLYALQQLAEENPTGWSKAWCVFAPESWDDATCLGFLVAHNLTSVGAEDDDEQLAALVREQQEIGADLLTLGMTPDMYRELLSSLPTLQETGDELDPFDFGTTKQLVLVYDMQSYTEVLEKLRVVRDRYRLGTDSDAVLYALDCALASEEVLLTKEK